MPDRPDTPQAMPVFVSHSHEDDAFCRQLVTALRGAGANVWYDEHNMDSGQLMDTIERELRARPVFVLILSPAALRSQWVRDESKWAYAWLKRDPTRIILPVLAAPLADEDDIWMFLQDFKRIEAPGVQPLPTGEAVRRTLHALALTPAGEAPAPTAPQPTDSADDLIARGKALLARQDYREAISLFEHATQLAPSSFDAWFNLGFSHVELHHRQEGIAAYERALTLDANSAPAWNNKGAALRDLKRPEEALAACARALVLDPTFARAWSGKGGALRDLKRYGEALAAYERALAFDPNDTFAWNGKGGALYILKRPAEALAAYERVLALDPNDACAWNGKGAALCDLKRPEEALAACARALVLDPNFAFAWYNKGAALYDLERYQEALAAYECGFDRNNWLDWNARAKVLHKLGRETEAQEAEARAKALGG